MTSEQDVSKSGDQVKIERTEKTTESTASDSVIAGQHKHDHQSRHQQMEKAGQNFGSWTTKAIPEREDGETDQQYKARLKQIEQNSNPLILTDGDDVIYNAASGLQNALNRLDSPDNEPISNPKNDQLLASKDTGKTTPDDGRYHFQNPELPPGQDIAGAIKEWIWNGDGVNQAWSIAEPAVKAINEMLDFRWRPMPKGAYRDYLEGRTTSFDSERKESAWRSVDLDACKQAYNAFSDRFEKYGISKSIIGGTILDEVMHRDPREPFEDLSVQMFGTVRNADGSENENASIGPGQIQIRNIKRLMEAKDHQGNPKYPVLQQFKNDPLRAAIDPAKAPFFVAAYYAEVIDRYEDYNRTHDPDVVINDKSVLYSYCPDVYSHGEPSDKSFRSIEPADVLKRFLTKAEPEWKKSWNKEPIPVGEVPNHSNHVRSTLKAKNVIEHYM